MYIETVVNHNGDEVIEEPDYIFKVIIVGDSGTGKSNLLTNFIFEEFSFDSKATVGCQLFTKTFHIENKVVIMQLWDTAGQERYKSITKSYFKGAKGALVVYDLVFDVICFCK